MKTIAFFALSFLVFHASGQSFIKRLKQTAQSAAENTILNTSSEAVSRKTVEILSPNQTPTGDEATENSQIGESVPPKPGKSTAIKGAQLYSKFDFIPGEEIVYFRDFEGEIPGELPSGWNTNGSGAVIKLSNQTGTWLHLHQASDFLTDNEQEFGENFTIEFDLVCDDFGNQVISFPAFWFGFLDSGSQNTTSNELFDSPDEQFLLLVNANLIADSNGNSSMQLSSTANYDLYFQSAWKTFPRFETLIGQTIHVSMQIQQERFRMWMNEEKLFDVPKAVAKGIKPNQLFFRVSDGGRSNDEVGLFITNLKIAKGIADTRHQLINEGHFATSAIQFEVAQSSIKPESYGILREIATLLQSHPKIQIEIVGHTDSDGSEPDNLKLSADRAIAVKNSLSQDFGVAPERMKTSGKGESVPIAKNNTPGGKAMNRRVEFNTIN